MAKHNQSSLKRSKRAQQRISQQDNNAMYDATYSTWGAVKRIRTPHPHDVLSGRGGGINMHAGNTQFRAWVAERKNDYNLAVSKQAKAQVAREVIELVQAQDPPGRFLIKDPTSTTSNGWWVEADDEKVMAKTSQALREGAPQIRAAHRDEIEDKRAELKRRRKEEPVEKPDDDDIVYPSKINLRVPTQLAMNALKANAEAAMEDYDTRDNSKRVRIDYQGQYVYPSDATPPLSATDAPMEVETLDLPPAAAFSSLSPLRSKSNGGLTRNNSLALSEFDTDLSNEEFVNPFEDERDVELLKDALSSPRPRPGIYRESSVTSDNGGLGALFRSNDSHQSASSANSFGVRSWNSLGNTSSRSLTSVLSDLPKELSLNMPHDDFYEDVKSLKASLEIESDNEFDKPRVTPRSPFPHSRRVPSQLTRGLDGRQ